MIFNNAPELAKEIKGKYIFLDNDALSLVIKDKNTFSEFNQLMRDGWPILDPYTVFELRRDLYDVKKRRNIEDILDIDYFSLAENTQESFIKIQDNALLLSRIYAQQISGKKSWSSIDLLLAGRIMYNNGNAVLITGNKKDFPSCVFDTVGVINLEDETNGNMLALSVIEFNKKKFDVGFTKYNNLK